MRTITTLSKHPFTLTLGLSFFLSWPYSIFLTNSLSLPKREGLPLKAEFWFVSLIAVTATLFLLAVFGDHADRLLKRKGLAPVASIIWITACFIISYCSQSSPDTLNAIVLIAGMTTGIATGLLQIQWGQVIGAQNEQLASLIIPIGYAGAFFETFLLTFVPESFAPLIILALITAGSLILSFATDSVSTKPESLQGRADLITNKKLTDQAASPPKQSDNLLSCIIVRPFVASDLISIFFCYLSWSFIDGLNRTSAQATSPNFQLAAFISALTAIVVALFFAFGSRNLTFGSLGRFLMPLLLVCLLFSSSQEAILRDGAFVVLFSSNTLIPVFIWIAGSTYSSKQKGGAARALGIPLAIHYLGTAIGSLVGFFTTNTERPFIAFIISTCFAAIIIALKRPEQTQPPIVAHIYVDPRAEAIANIVRTYEFTNRETEIFSLFTSGRNAAYICETCFISKNTVDTHLRHIYDKTGIRSKQGLIDLVEAEQQKLLEEHDPAVNY